MVGRRNWIRVGVLLLALGLVGALASFGVAHWRAARHLEAGRAALARRDFAAAREHLDRCLELRPAWAEAQLLAAQAARRAEDYDAAERHLARCQSLGGRPDRVKLEWALLTTQRGQLTAEGERYLVDLAEAGDPDALLIWEGLTQFYVQTQRVSPAVRCANRILELAPDHVQALLWHGWGMERVNGVEQALDDYEKAAALAPDNVWARLSLGEVLLNRNRPGDALPHFEYLRERLPDNDAVLLGLARCRRGLGQSDEAHGLIDRLLAIRPDEPLLLDERGQLALQEGQLQEAERWLTRAVEKAPYLRRALFGLQTCLLQQGRADEAETFRRRIAQLDADHKRLTELSQELLKPGRAPCQRCEAGVLCLRLGLEPEGVRWLESALQDDPALPEAHRALAEYYQRKGRPDRAEYHRWLAK